MEAQARDEDKNGILASRDYFHSLIQEEIAAGIPADRIVLGGFSQGGAMSIFSGLTAPVKIGGIVGLSSWLLLNRAFSRIKDHKVRKRVIDLVSALASSETEGS